jgi:magnesium chelatase family protein
LENLRQPLEAGEITIARARTTITFPADFILVASQNPCPCGYFGDSEKNCTCSLSTIHNYQKRISGPLLDRIDLHVSVPRENFNNLHSNTAPESSDVVRGRVLHARKLQSDRFKVSSITTNHEMEQKEITEFCTLPDSGINLLKNAVERLHLSTRTYFRIIKVARTIADLQAHGTIQTNDIAEALQYRIVH